MNRQQRRKLDRKAKKGVEAIKSLTPTQTEVIKMAVQERVSQRLGEFAAVVDRNMTAGLMDRGWNLKEIEKLQIEMAEGAGEDGEALNALEKEKVDMAKLEADVREAIVELINKGVNRKEAIKELQFKFPKLSKSMITVSYGRVKEEITPKTEQITREKIVELAKIHGLDKAGKQKIAEDLKATYSTIATYVSRWNVSSKDLHEAEDEIEEEVAKVIFGDDGEEEKKDHAPKKTKKVVPVAEKTIKEEPKKENVQMENNLEVIKLTVKGKNGTYEACGEGVRLNMDGNVMAFKTVAELEQFTGEFKAVFGMVR